MTKVGTREKAVEILLEHNVATMDEILLVANLNGFTMETLRSILYVRTKYRDFDRFLDATKDNEFYAKRTKDGMTNKA